MESGQPSPAGRHLHRIPGAAVAVPKNRKPSGSVQDPKVIQPAAVVYFGKRPSHDDDDEGGSPSKTAKEN